MKVISELVTNGKISVKKGFTFIEIMVVVVIVGILAAASVPKFLGAIAKSKATEVTVTVSEWDKLETAYIGNKKIAGTWKDIGFDPPGKEDKDGRFATSYFKYREDLTENNKSGSGTQLGISVYNTIVLNDCTPDEKFSHWQFKVITPKSGDAYIIQPLTGNTAECLVLTPTLQNKYPGITNRNP